MDWGSAPKDPANPGPNEWNTVHSIQISNDRKLYVVDRGHRRLHLFPGILAATPVIVTRGQGH